MYNDMDESWVLENFHTRKIWFVHKKVWQVCLVITTYMMYLFLHMEQNKRKHKLASIWPMWMNDIQTKSDRTPYLKLECENGYPDLNDIHEQTSVFWIHPHPRYHVTLFIWRHQGTHWVLNFYTLTLSGTSQNSLTWRFLAIKPHIFEYMSPKNVYLFCTPTTRLSIVIS